jgi:dihydrodipicolinate synthase/N-acetylneuraminate lyase
MFISNEEKQSINDKLIKLKEIIDKLTNETVFLSAKIRVLEEKIESTKPRKPRKKMTEEQRKAKQKEYNRRYTLRKRLEKKVENVST